MGECLQIRTLGGFGAVERQIETQPVSRLETSASSDPSRRDARRLGREIVLSSASARSSRRPMSGRTTA